MSDLRMLEYRVIENSVFFVVPHTWSWLLKHNARKGPRDLLAVDLTALEGPIL